MQIQNSYDVIIIGAGPAGLECARGLAKSNLSVLLINKDKIHYKICCNYLPVRALEFLPMKVMKGKFSHVDVNYHGIGFPFFFGKDLVYFTNRKTLFNWYMAVIKKNKNISYLGGICVSQIYRNFIVLQDGTKIKFKHLVGADGASSIVRNYLGLSSEKTMLAIQYPSKINSQDIKIFFDRDIFPYGYGWVGAHKNYTVIGGGVPILKSKNFKKNLDNWIERNKFKADFDKIQSSILNCDYRGYNFGNIFLAGDAAGLTSALTGEGIYPAMLSGKQIAFDILGKKKNLLKLWTINKKRQESIINIFNNLPRSRVLFSILSALFGRILYKLLFGKL
jgi:geranylgeranyl reductase